MVFGTAVTQIDKDEDTPLGLEEIQQGALLQVGRRTGLKAL